MSEAHAPSFEPVAIPTPEELASFDPLSTPGPMTTYGNVRITAEPSLGTLSPEMKGRVTEKLAGIAPARHGEALPGLITEELRQHSLALRVKAGPGLTANEYQREYFCIAREAYDIDQEMARTQADIDDVTGYSHSTDEMGEPVAVPIYRFAKETREGRAQHLQSLRHKRTQLERESVERLRQAAERERAKRVDLNDRASLEVEAREMADVNERAKRVEDRAAAINRNRDTIR